MYNCDIWHIILLILVNPLKNLHKQILNNCSIIVCWLFNVEFKQTGLIWSEFKILNNFQISRTLSERDKTYNTHYTHTGSAIQKVIHVFKESGVENRVCSFTRIRQFNNFWLYLKESVWWWLGLTFYSENYVVSKFCLSLYRFDLCGFRDSIGLGILIEAWQ